MLIDQSRQSASPYRVQGSATQRTAHCLALTSGKGGVGTSLIALNLAIALGMQGQWVCLLDADLGMGNLELLSGLTSPRNLSHVIDQTCSLAEVMRQGPAGIALVPGAAGLTELADLPASGREQLLSELSRLDQEFDFLLVDCGSGIHPGVRQIASSADTVVLTSTLECTALADTYAAFKIYHQAGLSDVQVLFNRAEQEQASQVAAKLKQTAAQFLGTDLPVLGSLPDSELLIHSVASRHPFLPEHAQTAPGRALARISDLLIGRREHRSSRFQSPFVKRLQAGSLSAA